MAFLRIQNQIAVEGILNILEVFCAAQFRPLFLRSATVADPARNIFVSF